MPWVNLHQATGRFYPCPTERRGMLVIHGQRQEEQWLNGECVGMSYVYCCLCDCGTQVMVPHALLFKKRSPVRDCGCKCPAPPDNIAILRRYFTVYQKSTAKRNILWEMPFPIFQKICGMNCTYCGSLPTPRKWSRNIPINGIDRVDNNKGYTSGNVAAACGRCNRMKGTMTANEFLGHCGLVGKVAIEPSPIKVATWNDPDELHLRFVTLPKKNVPERKMVECNFPGWKPQTAIKE